MVELALFFLQWVQAESVLSEAGKTRAMGEREKKGKHMNEQLSKATRKQIIPFALSYSYLHTPNLTLLTDTFSLCPLGYSLTLFIASSAAHHQTRLRLLLHSSLGSVLVLVLPEGGFPIHLPSVPLPHLSRIVLPSIALLEGTT